MKSQQFYKYAFLIALAYIALFLVFPQKKDETPAPTTGSGRIVLETTKKSFHPGEAVKVRIENKTSEAFVFNPLPCPGPPLQTAKMVNEQRVFMGASVSETRGKCSDEPITVVAGKDTTVSMDAWTNILFSEPGTYAVSTETAADTPEIQARFEIGERGTLGKTWELLGYQPMYNLLIWLTSILPGHDLGWAIVLLTLIIRLILLIPNQKALESQKRLQVVQPKIQEIQKKYEGDTKKIGEETMKLWKEHKVNPMGSCLPLILQMPFLIALYYAVQHGLDQSSAYYLYEPLQNFPVESIRSNFLGILELSKPNFYVLPVALAILQWYQMYLSLGKNKAGDAATKDLAKGEEKNDQMKMMNKAMQYAMPLLIGVMSVSFPAGVSLYWGVSTLFGIAQQMWVNRMADAK